MANESYESFAEQLQKEIEEEEGIKFGVVEKHLFANITVSTDDYTTSYLGTEASAQIYDHLKAKGYIDIRGKVQDSLKSDLKSGEIDLPAEFSDQEGQIMSLLKKVTSKLNIKNKDNRETLKLNKAVFLSEDFKQLWERIKYRTTFRVDFDPEKLIHKCAEEIQNSLVVGRARFTYRKVVAEIDRGGIHAEEVMEREGVFESQDYELPDIITYLQNETNLTRRTLVEILKTCGRLEEFKNNPQKFVEQVSSIIKHQMRLFIVDGIKYEKIGDEYYYAQQLFADEEVKGYLGENLIESQKSIYNYVKYDSNVEAGFATRFELSDDVKVYAKLPDWFKIDTPLGSYTPDWAVLVEIDGQEKLYFVVETKGSLFTDALRPTEQAKIECGRAHFKAMGNDVEFALANNYEAFSTELSKHGNPQ